MRAIMANEFERLGIVARDELDGGIRADGIAEIAEHAVQENRYRALGEALGDAVGEVQTGESRLDLALGAIGKRQRNHPNLRSLPRTKRVS